MIGIGMNWSSPETDGLAPSQALRLESPRLNVQYLGGIFLLSFLLEMLRASGDAVSGRPHGSVIDAHCMLSNSGEISEDGIGDCAQ